MSRFALQKPYSVATLPRPIDQSSGRYVVGDVHGGALGSKKRKRSELAIGIDGRISSSRLLTSYALPPQTSFTCPPTSTRTRISKNKVERRTYVSTIQPQAQITLFYESTGNKQAAQSFSETHKLSGSQAPVRTETTTENLDILLVKRDGEVQCLDGNNLQERWISPERAWPGYCYIFEECPGGVCTVDQRICSKSSEESIGSMEITEDGFNPHVLFILLKSGKSSSIRTAHIVSTYNYFAAARGHEFEDAAVFSLQASSGTIQQLIRDTVIPSIWVISFQRLSTTSIMVSRKVVSVFNPKYRSIMGSVLSMIRAKDEGKHRASGLLIDSIGYSRKRLRSSTSDADVAKPSLSPLDVDKRWIIYGLSKIYSWTKTDEAEYQLRVQFYPPNTFMWLLKTGHMTIANIESALRMNIRESALDALPSGELVNAINELDPSLDFLRILISKTYLNASELVTAIQKVMDSLELFGDNAIVQQQLLTNGNGAAVDSMEVDVNHLEEEVEDDLALIEYQLGAGFGARGEMLHLALSKLYTCPTNDIIYALQTIFTNEQIVSLIYQLRLEMREGAWTSRYLDDLQSDELDDEAEMSNNSIIIIASLLHNCVDAIGAGGWITGNVRLFNGDAFEAEDLITSLKSEVSAALEAIEEAAYLKGIISEMVRYGDSVQQVLSPAVKAAPPTASGKKRKARHRKPVLVPFVDEAGKMLPFGLKADQNISLLKVGAGGEVYRRTRRDIGHLKSKKVPKYSLERVVV
ncbi:hypothetical protein B0O99DRAFT_610818 [Bisporella sp. PMI_857]|nr:hypothetical protein B0O99DRAFT_610818 [Bisporella sp. PMI_857]